MQFAQVWLVSINFQVHAYVYCYFSVKGFAIHRYDVVLKCWEHDANTRPCFSDVVQILSDMLDNMAEYFDFTAVPYPAVIANTHT